MMRPPDVGRFVHHRPTPDAGVALWDVWSTVVRFWSGRYLCNAAKLGALCPGLILLPVQGSKPLVVPVEMYYIST